MFDKKILICDDDPGILEVLELVLQSHYTVIAEADSIRVMDLIRSHNPDLLLVDLWMPYLSGDQLMNLIRRNPDTADLPILAISASQDGREIALNAGANAFLAKPVELEDLLKAVKTLLAGTPDGSALTALPVTDIQ
ncbi:MAG: response regulator [Chitinophagaceae bacterium]|nr:response regulator [Chitinophagaceae bacterium]